MKSKTSIIILSYNTQEYLQLCIESIRTFTTEGTYELIVIENASKDGSASWLKKQKDIIAIYNEENQGFPKGCNQGLEIATGDDLLLLNSDTIVTQNWLQNLRQALYSSPRIGAVGCVTNWASNDQEITGPYKNLAQLHAFAADYNQSNPAAWEQKAFLVGFCYLFKREVYEKIGFLDEQFSPGNYEDDDYSLRILQADYDLLLCRDTFIHHFGSASFVHEKAPRASHEMAKKYNAILARNKLLFRAKWHLPPNYKTIPIEELRRYVRVMNDRAAKLGDVFPMIQEVTIPDFSPFERTVFTNGSSKRALITLGRRSYLADGSMEFGSHNCHVLIGRYSSLAHRLVFEVGLNHDYRQVTTYPFDDILQKDDHTLNHAARANHNQIIIGSDVWIGCDVKILGGVHIGNGAVIGAGTVVAKNIPPYAVVVGNPARIIKYRFSQKTIEKLQQIKWWYWEDEKIQTLLSELKDADAFVEKFAPQKTDAAEASEIVSAMKKLRTEGYKLYYFLPDFTSAEGIWKTVIDAYLQTYCTTDKVALVLGLPAERLCRQELACIGKKLNERGEAAPLLLSHPAEGQIIVPVLQQADCFITTKEGISSQGVDYASDVGMEIIYGLDEHKMIFPKNNSNQPREVHTNGKPNASQHMSRE